MASTLSFQPSAPNKPLHTIIHFIATYWFQCFLLVAGLHLLFNKEISVQVNVQSLETPIQRVAQKGVPPVGPQAATMGFFSETPAPRWKASDFSNTSFIVHPDLAAREGVGEELVNAKLENCRKYVERFAEVAIAEQKRYGVPVSIMLAQAILASDAGQHPFALEANNHFALPCSDQSGKTACKNYVVEGQPRALRQFANPWAGFREHSLQLTGSAYAPLHNIDKTDYKGWAKGLAMAGYSTDPSYADKLIRLVEALDLYYFDRT